MATVLIVDDERGYREMLSERLALQGHEVKTAANGREAIDIGRRCHPDVLVADWMLRGDLHGLHVSDALRTVVPEMRTILITGFASPDLKFEARAKRVFDFIEQPFEVERLEQAVRNAVTAVGTETEGLAIPVVEIDAAGTITYANPAVRGLLAETRAGRQARTLADILGTDATVDLELAAQGWLEVSPAVEPPITWHVRSKNMGDAGWVIVLLKDDRVEHARHDRAVQMLLGVVEPVRNRWPFEGRVLIIDSDELLRRLAITAFDRIGCLCHAAETRRRGLLLFERDPDIEFVILDYDTPGDSDLGEFVSNLKAVRPNATLVGYSDRDRRADFAAVGVDRFIAQPWRIDDLINLLTGGIR